MSSCNVVEITHVTREHTSKRIESSVESLFGMGVTERPLIVNFTLQSSYMNRPMQFAAQSVVQMDDTHSSQLVQHKSKAFMLSPDNVIASSNAFVTSFNSAVLRMFHSAKWRDNMVKLMASPSFQHMWFGPSMEFKVPHLLPPTGQFNEHWFGVMYRWTMISDILMQIDAELKYNSGPGDEADRPYIEKLDLSLSNETLIKALDSTIGSLIRLMKGKYRPHAMHDFYIPQVALVYMYANLNQTVTGFMMLKVFGTMERWPSTDRWRMEVKKCNQLRKQRGGQLYSSKTLDASINDDPTWYIACFCPHPEMVWHTIGAPIYELKTDEPHTAFPDQTCTIVPLTHITPYVLGRQNLVLPDMKDKVIAHNMELSPNIIIHGGTPTRVAHTRIYSKSTFPLHHFVSFMKDSPQLKVEYRDVGLSEFTAMRDLSILLANIAGHFFVISSLETADTGEITRLLSPKTPGSRGFLSRDLNGKYVWHGADGSAGTFVPNPGKTLDVAVNTKIPYPEMHERLFSDDKFLAEFLKLYKTWGEFILSFHGNNDHDMIVSRAVDPVTGEVIVSTLNTQDFFSLDPKGEYYTGSRQLCLLIATHLAPYKPKVIVDEDEVVSAPKPWSPEPRKELPTRNFTFGGDWQPCWVMNTQGARFITPAQKLAETKDPYTIVLHDGCRPGRLPPNAIYNWPQNISVLSCDPGATFIDMIESLNIVERWMDKYGKSWVACTGFEHKIEHFAEYRRAYTKGTPEFTAVHKKWHTCPKCGIRNVFLDHHRDHCPGREFYE